MTKPSSATLRAAHRDLIRARWEDVTRWPLIVLSLGFLIAYSVVAISSERSRDEALLIIAVMAIAWIAFIVDPIVRLALTPRFERVAYFRAHRIEFFSALLPIMRPFTLLKSLQLLPGFIGNGGNALRSRVIATAAAYAAMFVYIIAITVLQVERDAEGATIRTFGDAIWWACVTLATVGYGDYVPVTGLGRTFAVALMAGGVVIVGTASALVVSFLGERINVNNRNSAHRQQREGAEAPPQQPSQLQPPPLQGEQE